MGTLPRLYGLASGQFHLPNVALRKNGNRETTSYVYTETPTTASTKLQSPMQYVLESKANRGCSPVCRARFEPKCRRFLIASDRDS